MTTQKFLYGLYNDDDIMISGIKSMQEKGIKVKDAYTPFPVHGLENVLGIKWTRLAICAFLYGLTGLTLAMLAINFFMINDWPMNIGGKPSQDFYQNLPAFVPIIFEFTVLSAAHGMAITYFLRNMTLPGLPARNPHPRTTDDHFAIEISTKENKGFSKEDIQNMLKDTGVVEIFEKERIVKFI
jgi:hypothetical protein